MLHFFFITKEAEYIFPFSRKNPVHTKPVEISDRANRSKRTVCINECNG